MFFVASIFEASLAISQCLSLLIHSNLHETVGVVAEYTLVSNVHVA